MNVFIKDEAVKSIEETIRQAELKEEFSGWIAGKATAFSLIEMIMQSRNNQNQILEDINFVLHTWKEVDKKYCKDKGLDYFENN
jgi:hypothetical protein